MKQATIVALKVGLNHTVGKGQILCELETDKATLELESPAAGTIRHIFCAEGQTLDVGAPLFMLGQPNEVIDPAVLNKLQAELVANQPLDSGVSATSQAASAQSAGDNVLGKVRPATGPLGAIESLPDEARAPLPEIAAGTKIPLNRWQKIIADKMLESKQQIPCFYLNIRADITDLSELRDRLNKTAAEKYSFNDFIMAALAKGMKQYPIMTGQLGHDCIILSPTIDIGLAIAAGHGLVAPVVRDVGGKTLEQIAAAGRDLIARAKDNKLTADDLAGGCITISNLGGMGIDSFIPIVVPGQCSILGVGRIISTPMPSGKGDILIRKIMNLNLSVDHRIANGADAAQFLDYVKKQLEHPDELAN